ncbi:MAG: AI-2E family transporter [Acidobacteria bacterium]|nr:AI-2E family transporter [Acidobacteriota bacterium]
MNHDDPRALIRYALVGLVVTTALAWTLFLARNAILLIYVSALVAIGLAPLAAAIERWRLPRLSRRAAAGARATTALPRWAAILIIYLALLALLAALGRMVFPPLITQARAFWSALPQMLSRSQQWLIDRGLLSRELSFREAVEQAPLFGSDAVGTLVGALSGFVGGIFGIVTILILAFYLLIDAENIVRTFVRLFPSAQRPRVEDACRRVSTKVSAWLGGQLLLAGIIGSTAALGLFLLGVPYFYVLALIAGIGEMVPIVGPLLAALPAVAVAFTVSPALALGVAIFFFAQQQFENHVLVPKVMERQVGVSAVTVIVALLLGGSLLGIVGAILAVPTAAIAQVLFEELGPEGASR